jgi:precorrin-6A/cobalt-precorrin-6A reductase
VLLLLAGTSEARELTNLLANMGVPAVASLAGATRDPGALALPTRSGGFGGDTGFETYLADHDITAVLDATHPFAVHVSERTARICRELGLEHLQLLRQPWEPGPGDNWVKLPNEENAASHIGEADTVFLATGRQTLERFRNLSGRRLICRQIDPPTGPFPFPNGEFLVGRPPFSVEQEVALFSRLGVDWLVVKNAGGTASRSKLDAARELAISVAMIERPKPLACEQVETVGQAMAWVRGLTW